MIRLSVIVPVLDDAPHLERCLQLLASQTLAPSEIVVVDNGSSDDSVAVATRHGARVVHEPLRGIPSAAARGYDAATGDVIVRCDADTRPPADWLERVHRVFTEDPSLSALTGPGRFYDLPPVRGWVARVFYMRGYYWGIHAALAGVPLWGSNMALSASCWESVRERVHRTDPMVHDDIDLSFQLDPTMRVRYDRELVVGVAGRTFASPAAFRRRFTWAFHTLSVNWRTSPPWERWRARFTRPRSGASPAGPAATEP
ncbi:glycosyltransferase family 2 protein [Sanguibacter antarcticus]|uniref:4,4'-diaponeurosporenoate glycosyltransferase n=1 Tax=Sanguibacter antarcticus TaxID=372484 RepID=A0A2A9E6U7_9MICO|nr:glycosyltransferase family 2 protein [Sanguibacter antarcticus]PFG34787.1 glycosyl transferase family 2 [Sanguibacter antarcticus]